MTTFVTGFFNVLPADHPLARGRFDDYCEKSNDLLKYDMNLVFYGDESMAIHVYKQRKALGFADKTYIYVLPFTELPMYERQAQINDLYIHGDPESSFTRCGRFTPRYQMVILSKIYLLERTIKNNPFESSHFVWIDFGYFRHSRSMPTSYAALPSTVFQQIENSFKDDRLRIAAVSAPCEHYKDVKVYNKAYRQAVAANVFGGSKVAINAVLEKYNEELNLVFSKNILACEENIFGRLMMLYPKLFDVFVARYTTVLNNFAFQTMSFDYCVHLICKFCFFSNNHAELSNCLRIYDGIKAGRYDEKSVDMINLYNYICIALFYLDRDLYQKYKQEALAYFKAHNLVPNAAVLRNLSF